LPLPPYMLLSQSTDHQSLHSSVYPSVQPITSLLQPITSHNVTYPILIHSLNSFNNNSPTFSHIFKHLSISCPVFTTNFLQSSPYAHLKCIEPLTSLLMTHVLHPYNATGHTDFL